MRCRQASGHGGAGGGRVVQQWEELCGMLSVGRPGVHRSVSRQPAGRRTEGPGRTGGLLGGNWTRCWALMSLWVFINKRAFPSARRPAGELYILKIRFNQVSIINMIMATGLAGASRGVRGSGITWLGRGQGSPFPSTQHSTRIPRQPTRRLPCPPLFPGECSHDAPVVQQVQ